MRDLKWLKMGSRSVDMGDAGLATASVRRNRTFGTLPTYGQNSDCTVGILHKNTCVLP